MSTLHGGSDICSSQRLHVGHLSCGSYDPYSTRLRAVYREMISNQHENAISVESASQARGPMHLLARRSPQNDPIPA